MLKNSSQLMTLLIGFLISCLAANVSIAESEWQSIAGGGDSKCSDGSPYRFFVRKADPEKLLFYMQGGGACWSYRTCRKESGLYSMKVPQGNVSYKTGIFDPDNSVNPFANHTVVFAPYCSADVHLGDVTRIYRGPAAEDGSKPDLTIHHRGKENIDQVLNWTARNVNPGEIFVTGSSAGSVPSPVYAVDLGVQFPRARISQLGDGSGAYRDLIPDMHSIWNTKKALAKLTSIHNIPSQNMDFYQLYWGAYKMNPRIQYASYDTAEDKVVTQFLEITHEPFSKIQPFLNENLKDISNKVDSFRYYVAGGKLHTLLAQRKMYTYRVGNISFLDWLTAYAGGEPVSNVFCSSCELAEEIQ